MNKGITLKFNVEKYVYVINWVDLLKVKIIVRPLWRNIDFLKHVTIEFYLNFIIYLMQFKSQNENYPFCHILVLSPLFTHLSNTMLVNYSWAIFSSHNYSLDITTHYSLFKYTLQKIKPRLKARNSSYCSVQTLLYSRLLSKNLKIKIYKTRLFSVVLCSFEMWSFMYKKKFKLRIFEDRFLRRIFQPKRDAKGEWRTLHNEELHSLYCSSNILRVINGRGICQNDGKWEEYFQAYG